MIMNWLRTVLQRLWSSPATTDLPWHTIHVATGLDRYEVARAAHAFLARAHTKPFGDGPPSVLVESPEHIAPVLRLNPDTVVYVGPVQPAVVATLLELALTGHKVIVPVLGTAEDFACEVESVFREAAFADAGLECPRVIALQPAAIPSLV